ncbi:phage tail tape measure protein [Arsenicicoccus dermatophilus]|uniref:phage tail tape measure protein n=2 Tax=Arsenicicoccus dermatophilus TaxID=1076331 RepID=UPI003917505F
MPDFNTTVTLRGDVTDLVSGFQRATAAVEKFEAAAKRSGAASQAGMSGLASGAAKAEQAQSRVAASAARGSAAVEQAYARQAGSADRVVAATARTERAHTQAGAAAVRAGQATERATTRTASAIDRASAGLAGFAKASAMSVGGLVVAGGIAKLATSFLDFDAAMSGVRANTGATGAELDSLRASAISAGQATKYSATEAASGINELAKAGISTKDILGGGLSGALNLAAAGQMDVADAAETAASAMTQFELTGRHVPGIADMLSNAANSAQGSVKDMGDALNQTGLVAHGMGMSMQDTVTALTLFAKAGMTGSDAGTSLKTMIQRLQNPTDQARTAMDQLGLSVYDAQGRFVGMRSIFDQLQTSTKGMAQNQKDAALATIFGADAVRGANAAIAAGASEWDKAAAAVTKWGGASRQAAALNDNLKGDLEELGGSLETLFIKGGGLSDGFLRPAVQGVTGLVNVLGQVPAPVMGTVSALTAMALVGPRVEAAMTRAGAAGKTFLSSISDAARATTPLQTVSTAARTVGTELASTSTAARAFSAAVGDGRSQVLAKSLTETAAAAGKTAAPLAQTASAALSVGTSMGSSSAGVRSFVSAASDSRGSLLAKTLTDTGSAAGRATGPLSGIAATARSVGTSMGGLKGAVGGLVGLLGGPWGIALAAAGAALTIFGQKQAEAAAKVQELSAAYQADGSAVGEYTRKAFAAQAAQDGVTQTAQAAGVSMSDFAAAVTGTGEAYAAYRQKIDDMVGAHMDADGAVDSTGSALLRLNGNLADARGRYWEMIEAGASASEAAAAFGVTADQAGTAAGKIGSGAGQASAGLSVVGGQVQAAGDKASEAAGQFDQLTKAIAGMGSSIGGQREAVRGYQAALDGAAEAAAKNGRTLDTGTEKGRANQAALDGVANATLNLAAKSLQAGESVASVSARVEAGRNAFIAQGTAMGLTAAQAGALATSMGLIPENVQTMVDASGFDIAGGKVDALTGQLIGVDGKVVTVGANADTSAAVGQVQGLASMLATWNVTVPINGDVTPGVSSLGALAAAAAGTQAQVSIGGNIVPGVSSLAVLQAAANGTTATATIGANAGPAMSILSGWAATANATRPTPLLSANAAPAMGILHGWQGTANGARGTATLGAQSGPANATVGQWKGTANSAKGTATLAANNGPAMKSIGGTVAKANSSTGTIAVKAATSAAEGAINALTRTRTAVINVVQRVTGAIGGLLGNADGGPARTVRVPGYATGGGVNDYLTALPDGGAVHGPGSRTSDSITAFLSSGVVNLSRHEHVWTGAEVDAVGGHAAMYSLRAAARAGRFRVPGFATGGSTGGGGYRADTTKMLAGYSPVGAADVAKLRESWYSAIDSQHQAAKANFEAQTELRKAKRGTQAFADASWKAAEALRKYHAANAEVRSTQTAMNTAGRTSRMGVTSQWTATAATNNRASAAFIADVETIYRRGYPGLADALLQQGEAQAGRVAHDAARLPLAKIRAMAGQVQYSAGLEARRDAIAGKASAWTSAVGALSGYASSKRTAMLTSATFLANIRMLQRRGYTKLALALLNEGEESAGAIAAQAARATTKTLSGIQGNILDSERYDAQKKALADELAGKKKPVATRNPVISFTATEVAARSARAATAVSGPSLALRPIPAASIPSLPPAQVGRALIGSQTINVTEARSGYHTGQQVAASLSWQMGQYGGFAA